MIKKYLNNNLIVWLDKAHYGLNLVLTKNKSAEIELTYQKDFYAYFNFSAALTRHQDHAGLQISLEIAGLNLDINITDNRHWNHDKNRWYKPGEEALEQLAEEAHKLGITDDEPPE